MCEFIALWVQGSNGGCCSPGCRDPHQSLAGPENNHAIGAPRATKHTRGEIAQRLRRPSGNIDLVQFSARVVDNESVVGRPEWRRGIVHIGPRQGMSVA